MINKYLIFICFSLLFLLVSGCSPTAVTQVPEPERQIDSIINQAILSDSEKIKDEIYLQYREWKGTRYKYGGLSKQGVDCSGFVYITYLERLGLEIPRSTRNQSQFGKMINRDELRPGDLVFFKTGLKARHVGIYVEKDKFLHASTSKGVMISSLDDHYWQDKYWHSRRVEL